MRPEMVNDQVASLQVNDRVILVRWGPSDLIDDNVTVPPGTEGTVWVVAPEVNQIGVHWDNGSTLNLLIDHDQWRIKRKDTP